MPLSIKIVLVFNSFFPSILQAARMCEGYYTVLSNSLTCNALDSCIITFPTHVISVSHNRNWMRCNYGKAIDISARGRIHVRSVITDDFSWLRSFFLRRIIDTRSIILASHSLDQWLYFLVGRRHAQWCRRCRRLFVCIIHEAPSFSFAEAECCAGEAASEACWEPCYCVLLQDEQTLTAYRSEDMAVSTFFSKSLSDSPGFIHPAAVSLSPQRTRVTIIRHEMDLYRCCYMVVFHKARFVDL